METIPMATIVYKTRERMQAKMKREMETIKTFSADELQIVRRWIADRMASVEYEQNVIECGDDHAYLNGKGKHLDGLKRDESSLRNSLRLIDDQVENEDAKFR
jgi:hypothetical protein